MATNGNINHQDQYKAQGEKYLGSTDVNEPATSGGANHDLPKDEVGWYFVEQYYTTLNKSPEKLHLFYGKRSQFVYGSEAEVANISYGRPSIQERIKNLDFQDCKVRVSNVDSLSSGDNIVIQVIGETSNKSDEPKKFVQTFVLAKQPSGYFVLNDIWRYINDEGEEEAAAEAPAQEESPAAKPAAAVIDAEEPNETVPEPVSVETAAPVLDAAAAETKLEEVSSVKEETTTTETTPSATDATPVQAEAEVAATNSVAGATHAAEEVTQESEKPKEPTPTPVVPAKSPAPAPEPAKPMTWASRIAAAAGPPKPAVALPKAAPSSASAPARAAAPAAAPAAAAPPAAAASPKPTQPVAARAEAAATESPASTGEWQTAGADSKRQNRPQAAAGQADKDTTLGYVKHVTEKVQEPELRAILTSFGPVTYFDINRSKNCAFVEYATPEGYKAAVAANPHVINGENIVVEPRRPKATAYGGANYSSSRGNFAGRGRGFDGGNRSGGQGGVPRGNFGGQGRGRGGGMTRGKSTSQPTNA